jgi:hypothetical protein
MSTMAGSFVRFQVCPEATSSENAPDQSHGVGQATTRCKSAGVARKSIDRGVARRSGPWSSPCREDLRGLTSCLLAGVEGHFGLCRITAITGQYQIERLHREEHPHSEGPHHHGVGGEAPDQGRSLSPGPPGSQRRAPSPATSGNTHRALNPDSDTADWTTIALAPPKGRGAALPWPGCTASPFWG